MRASKQALQTFDIPKVNMSFVISKILNARCFKDPFWNLLNLKSVPEPFDAFVKQREFRF